MTINLGRELDRWMWGEQYETDGDIPTQAHAIPRQHQSSELMGELLDVCMEQCLSCPALPCTALGKQCRPVSYRTEVPRNKPKLSSWEMLDGIGVIIRIRIRSLDLDLESGVGSLNLDC